MVELYDTKLLKLRDWKDEDYMTVADRHLLYGKVTNRMLQTLVDLLDYCNLFTKIADQDAMNADDEGAFYMSAALKQMIFSMDTTVRQFCVFRDIEYNSPESMPDTYPVPCKFGTGVAFKGTLASLDARDYHGSSDDLGGGSD